MKKFIAPILFFSTLANADTALMGDYDPNYAMDFGRCPQHFYANTPPSLDLSAIANANLYPLCYNGFASLYAPIAKTPLFSAEHLTAERLNNADKLPRVDSFRVESRLPSDFQADPKNYTKQGLDKGHLAPNADMGDLVSQYDSFATANIAPQHPDHNRNLWRHIESHTRALTVQYGESYVVTGVLYNGKQVAVMNGIFVPSHFFKAVLLPKTQQAVVYYSPNDDSGTVALLSLDEFAHLTGITPFPNIKAEQSDIFAPTLPNDQIKSPAPQGILAWLRATFLAIKDGLS